MSTYSKPLQPRPPHIKELKLRQHTAYYNNSFLLRTEIVVNGQKTQVDINEKGWLTLNCRHPKAAVTFDSLIRQVDTTLQQHFIHGVSQYWCEEMPLFQLKVMGPDDLRKLFSLEKQIQEDIALKFNDSIATHLQSSNPEAPPPGLSVMAKMEVFFLIPDNVNKDGKLIRVDKDNLLHCVDLLKESVVFDFDAVCRAYRVNHTHEDQGPEMLIDLANELVEVVWWYNLGIQLKAPRHVLETIRVDHRSTEDQKNALFGWWLNNTLEEERKWSRIVKALARAGYRSLAERIAFKYSVSVPAPQEKCAASEQDNTQTSQSGIVQKIDDQVEKSRREIVSKDIELAQQNQTLKLAELMKKKITQSFPNIRKNLESSENTVKQLLSQKKNLEEQLKVKEDEMQFFRESSTEQKQWLNKLISQKEEEIASLKKELTRVTAELEKANVQIDRYEAQIREIQSDLSKKSEEIKCLRETNTLKKQQLNLKRKEVDQLRMQQTAAEESNANYRKETMKLIGNLEKEAQKRLEEVKELEKKLKEKEAEVLQLHQQISQESSIAQRKINLPDKTIHLSTLTSLIEQLCKAEDEQHQQSLNLTLSNREADYHQKQAEELRSKISKSSKPPPVAKKPQTHTSSTSTKQQQISNSSKPLPVDKKPQTHTSSTSTQQQQIKVETSQRKNTPCAMFRGSAAVDSAYIYIRPANSSEVYKYIIQQDMWIQLQDCPYQQSGLVMMNNCLMSVGGYTSSYVPTNKLFCLRGEEWKEQFPSMNTARFSPALAVQQHYLIVIGGYNQYCYSIASVEILDAESIKWSMLGNLPCPLDWPSATLCGEQLYVLAGKSDGEGYCCSLQELSTSSVLPPSLTWTPFPQPPVSDSTIATLSGVPVVVGGRGRGTGIYNSTVYALLDGQWVECGHLNEARSDCLVASLNTSHMLVVVGGIAFPGLVSATVQLCSVV